jgi:DnaJ like chaperone protein
MPFAYGRVLGALFGFLVYGPLGLFLGYFIGNFFDKRLKEIVSETAFNNRDQEKVADVFFSALFNFMGYLAKADGRVTEQELEAARKSDAPFILE